MPRWKREIIPYSDDIKGELPAYFGWRPLAKRRLKALMGWSWPSPHIRLWIWSAALPWRTKGYNCRKGSQIFPRESRGCLGEIMYKKKMNTWNLSKILYFLHVLPFSLLDSQFKPTSEKKNQFRWNASKGAKCILFRSTHIIWFWILLAMYYNFFRCLRDSKDPYV